MEAGSLYNLTAFSMCAHNGTHLDAPKHFLRDGASVEALPLATTVGEAFVAKCSGRLSALDAETVLKRAERVGASARRILLKNGTVGEEAARVFAAAGIDLIGTETQSVASVEETAAVHRILLESGILLLEGIRLGAISEGGYFLSAAPLSLEGADGAPVRAVLIDFS
jgi:arylformamidase